MVIIRHLIGIIYSITIVLVLFNINADQTER